MTCWLYLIWSWDERRAERGVLAHTGMINDFCCQHRDDTHAVTEPCIIVSVPCFYSTAIGQPVLLYSPPFLFFHIKFRFNPAPRECTAAALLVHVDAKSPQVRLGQFDLLHELLVRLGHVVEGEDAPAEAEEEECAERYEGPEGKLNYRVKNWQLHKIRGACCVGRERDIPRGQSAAGREEGEG